MRPDPARADDIVAELEARYADAYSAADPQQLSALFATDATVQTEWGPILDGRAEIESGLIALFASADVPNALVNTPVLSRQISANVIVSHGTALRSASNGTGERFLYTRVFVRRDEDWLIAANQIARPSEHQRPTGIGAS